MPARVELNRREFLRLVGVTARDCISGDFSLFETLVQVMRAEVKRGKTVENDIPEITIGLLGPPRRITNNQASELWPTTVQSDIAWAEADLEQIQINIVVKQGDGNPERATTTEGNHFAPRLATNPNTGERFLAYTHWSRTQQTFQVISLNNSRPPAVIDSTSTTEQVAKTYDQLNQSLEKDSPIVHLQGIYPRASLEWNQALGEFLLVIWEANNQIRAQRLNARGEKIGNTKDLAKGLSSEAVVDKDGNTHLAYVEMGGSRIIYIAFDPNLNSIVKTDLSVGRPPYDQLRPSIAVYKDPRLDGVVAGITYTSKNTHQEGWDVFAAVVIPDFKTGEGKIIATTTVAGGIGSQGFSLIKDTKYGFVVVNTDNFYSSEKQGFYGHPRVDARHLSIKPDKLGYQVIVSEPETIFPAIFLSNLAGNYGAPPYAPAITSINADSAHFRVITNFTDPAGQLDILARDFELQANFTPPPK